MGAREREKMATASFIAYYFIAPLQGKDNGRLAENEYDKGANSLILLRLKTFSNESLL